MIELNLLNESESIDLKLKENKDGGTKNYNDLDNKPQINGKTLQGNLTLEDLGIIVNAVKDILINGATIVDKDGVANIPRMSANGFGVAKIWNAFGINIHENGHLMMEKANTNDMNTRDANYKAIVPANFDYMLNRGMCDGKGPEWTSEEKASARARMGLEWRYIGKVETQEDVARMTMVLDENGQPFNLRKVRVKVVNYPNASDLSTNIRLTFNNMNESIFHDSTMMTGVKLTETMKVCEVVVEKIYNYLFPISVYTSLNNANASEILVTTTGTSYRHTLNEIDGYINQIDLYSWANVIGKGAYFEVWGVDA